MYSKLCSKSEISSGKESSPSLLVLRDAVSGSVSSPPSQSHSLFHCASRSHSLPPSFPLSLQLSLSNSPPSPFWQHLRSSFSHNSYQHTVISLSLSFQCSTFFLTILLFLHTLKMFTHSKIIKDFHLSCFLLQLCVLLSLVFLPASSHLHRPVPKHSNVCPLVTVVRHFS